MAGGANFGFLEQHDPQLMHLAQRAERYLIDDPNTCLIKLRQFGELLIKYVAAQHGLPEAENFAATITLLQREGVHASVIQGFHDLRRAGNDAVHGFRGDKQEALLKLKTARAMGTWYHRVTKDRSFEPGPFVPPQDSQNEQIQQLHDQLQAALLEKQRAQNVAETEARARAQAELNALQAAEEAAIWKSLAEESISQPTPVATVPLEELKTITAQQALDEDEADTRIKIDAQLRAAGWQVDSLELTYAKGARPQQGKSLALSEVPTPKGPADYVLYLGLTPVAVIEAKRKAKDVSASLEQARRYAEALPETIPFLFASNGRPYPQTADREKRHLVPRPASPPKPGPRAQRLVHSQRPGSSARARHRPGSSKIDTGAIHLPATKGLSNPGHPIGGSSHRRRQTSPSGTRHLGATVW